MRWQALAVFGLLVGTIADARADEEAAIKAVREGRVVLEVGKGSFIAFASRDPFALDREDPLRDFVYYGDGKVFHRLELRAHSSSREHQTRTWAFRDPRFTERSTIELANGAYQISCGGRVKPASIVPSADARKHVADATYEPPRLNRVAHMLGRLGTVYYLVDRSSADGSNDFRVYIGKRGALRQLAITDVASDAEGLAISTKVGSLRFTKKADNGSTGTWLVAKAKKPTALTIMTIADNLELVYEKLGVYAGRFGTPCD